MRADRVSPNTVAVVDNTIDYMDQASFLGLRARGRDPLIQWCWIYGHGVDIEALRRFHRNLGGGLLGRRIERSPLPFGRHRWVAWPGPDDIEIASSARPRSDVRVWANEQAARPIDPELGPSWRLAVLPLDEGGAAVTLIVSHTVADGGGAVVAVSEAVNGTTRDLGYPLPGSRSKRQALVEDSRVLMRGVPGMAKAVLAAAMVARNKRGIAGEKHRQPPPPVGIDSGREVTIPSVTVHVDAEQWDERARNLGGSGPTLLLGFGARCGQMLGWVVDDGMVTLSVPISERTPDDTRANALTNVTFTVDPRTVITDLSGVRAEFKSAMLDLDERGNEILAPLPLVPLVPQRAVRRLEGVVLKDKEVGCSYLGDLDLSTNRPDGTDAESSFFLPFEQHLTFGDLRRGGGILHPLISGRINGEVWVSIGFCNADGTTTREQLKEVAHDALADFGMTGIVE